MYKISKELINKIGAYLGSKTWTEVNNLILELQRVEEIKEIKKGEKSVEEIKEEMSKLAIELEILSSKEPDKSKNQSEKKN